MGITISNINRITVGSSGGYWTAQRIADTFLFYGETSKITGGKLYNQVQGSSDWLTVAGSAGSETYQAPDNATYQTADTDYIWFKQDTMQRTVTTAELIGYDLQRTPIKYMDDVPNTISIIGILKTGVTLTGSELDRLFALFQLPILWNDSLNTYGHIKSNRIGQNLWPILGPELIINGGAPETTDWIDSNSDGLGDTWILQDTSAPSIVSGNGFIGNAQRIQYSSNALIGIYKILAGYQSKSIQYSFTYRSSKAGEVQLMGRSISFSINNGNAINITGIAITMDNDFIQAFFILGVEGDYLEIDNFSIKEKF